MQLDSLLRILYIFVGGGVAGVPEGDGVEVCLPGSGVGGGGARGGAEDEASDWQLVCSGSLVNQRSVVVAAHCVTELGKLHPLDAAKLKVVMGKNYRKIGRASCRERVSSPV